MVRRDNSEVIMLYGHIHSNAPTGYVDGTFHVGVDTNGLCPVSIEEIWQQSWPNATDEILAYKAKYENSGKHECDV
jgi:calcineurin-like phosphoesterase family protein